MASPLERFKKLDQAFAFFAKLGFNFKKQVIKRDIKNGGNTDMEFAGTLLTFYNHYSCFFKKISCDRV